jgi:hypothetical protein
LFGPSQKGTICSSGAHIFIFFSENYKPDTIEDVDHMINVELSNLETNMLAHETDAICMTHGPCGATFPNAPCMEDGKCKKKIHANSNPRQ